MRKEEKVPRLVPGVAHPSCVYLLMIKLIYGNALFFEVFRQKCKVVLYWVPPPRAGRDSGPKVSSVETSFLVSPADTLSTILRASRGKR